VPPEQRFLHPVELLLVPVTTRRRFKIDRH
jgi:hypothetical protein